MLGTLASVGTTLVLAAGAGVGAGTAAIAAAPASTSPPTISGTAQEGQTLTASRGSWSGGVSNYTDHWMRCDENGGSCADISGATDGAKGYALSKADVGKTIRFRVTATNADGDTTATSVPTAVIKAQPTTVAPENTSPPTMSGTPQEGQRLIGKRGSWSGAVSNYTDHWMRCDQTGGSCANISGATDGAKGYVLTKADVGNTIRFRVTATNAAGDTAATSVPTAVIRAAVAPPPPNGCGKAGNGSIPVSQVSPPARLLVDQTQISPGTVTFGTTSVTVRFHVTACGAAVQGALVYVTATPYNQFSIPAEQQTGPDGWATLQMNKLSGFPATQNQQLLVMFVRARKSGESSLGGVSTRRLVSFRVTR